MPFGVGKKYSMKQSNRGDIDEGGLEAKKGYHHA